MSIRLKLAAARTASLGKGAGRRLAMALLMCGALALAPAAALAEADGVDMMKDAGIGMGSAVASLVYAPVKLVYAFGGMVVGGLAWAFSGGDSSVASIVLTPSVRGDYVVSRQQLLGERELLFFGRPRDYSNDQWEDVPVEEEVASASPSGW